MNDYGLIGLGVMGQSLALNLSRNGYSVSVFNRTSKVTKEFAENRIKDEKIVPYYDIKEFIESLTKPRKIIFMVKAGKPVDDTIEKILPFIEKGDIVIDGGNSYFKDTTRRFNELKEKGINYIGMGVSGGEKGALYGPSLMPGGEKESYGLVKDALLKIAAQTDSGPCCTFVGNISAGHFVKMVHNGIEYAIMQSIAEVYDIMRKVLKLSSEQIGNIFEEWNKGELGSYLMEISYKIMKHKDEETKKPLVELILDEAAQKGTGKWTAEASLDLGIPTPSLNLAVESRVLSFFKEERIKLSKMVKYDMPYTNLDNQKIIDDLKNTLLFTTFTSFSQGLWLISEASKEYNYDVDLKEILRIWKGGCIIRAKMLDYLREILNEDSENVNLLNNRKSIDYLLSKYESIKDVSKIAKEFYIPTPVINSSIDYFLSITEENLPANLIQAQRDCFGAHTYRRIDKEGTFHTEWEE